MNILTRKRAVEIKQEVIYPSLDDYIWNGDEEKPLAISYCADKELMVEVGLLHNYGANGINLGFKTGYHLIEWLQKNEEGDLVRAIRSIVLLKEDIDIHRIRDTNGLTGKIVLVIYENKDVYFKKEKANFKNNYFESSRH